MVHPPVSLDQLLTHQDWALRVARQLVHEEGEAEDLVQRTWMAAMRRPPESQLGIKAWIHKVILNLARERHRRRLARQRHERAATAERIGPDDPADTLGRAELGTLLAQQLLGLSEPYRSVILARYYEGQSSAEIARRLGIPAGTVRWRLKVGLDQLRTGLDRRSHGDRTRWVSALIAWLPTGVDPTVPEDLTGAAPPSVLALPPAAGWLLLATAAGIGALLLLRSEERAPRGSLGGTPSEALAASASDSRNERADRRELPVLAAEPDGEPGPGAEPAGLLLRVLGERGEPIPGAGIQVARATGYEARATTDDEGRVLLAVRADDPGSLGLPATRGRVSLRALAPGRVASELVHVAPPFTAEHEVRLVVGGPDARVRGRVLGTEGEPVPGAVVAWFEPEDQLEHLPEGDFRSPSYVATRSDERGEFELANLPPRTGSLGVLAPGFMISALFLDLREPTAFQEIRLGRGATLTGRVRGPDGAPVANATVACEPTLKAAEWAMGLPGYEPRWRGFGETTHSDENGDFRLEGIQTMTLRTVWAWDETRALRATRGLPPGSLEDDWQVELREGPTFRLKLVDEAQRPLSGWFALLRRPLDAQTIWTRRLPADAEGRVVLVDCPDGEATLDVFAPTDSGGSFAWRSLWPSPEEQLVQIDLGRRSVLRGQLVDSVGQPELRGRLMARSERTLLCTQLARDEQGRFEQELAPGIYLLTLQLPQTMTSFGRFRTRPGQENDLGLLSSPPMGSLRLDGAALFGRGGSLPHYSLYRLADDPDERAFLMVGTGELDTEVLLPVFPGRYRVLSFDSAGELRASEVRVGPHAETRLELVPGRSPVAEGPG